MGGATRFPDKGLTCESQVGVLAPILRKTRSIPITGAASITERGYGIRISVVLTERTARPCVGVYSMLHQESSSLNHISQALVFSEMKFANVNFEYTLKFTLWPRSCATILVLNLVALCIHECKTMIERNCELFAVFMLILKLNNFQVLFYSKYSFSMIKNVFLCVFHWKALRRNEQWKRVT